MSELLWGKTSYARQQLLQAQGVFYAACALVAGPPATLLAWGLSRLHFSRRFYALGIPVSLVWLWLLWGWLRHAPSPDLALGWWWGGWLVASPALAGAIHLWRRLLAWMRPRDLAEQLVEEQRIHEQEILAQSAAARRAAQQPAAGQPGRLTLGVYIQGDVLPAYLQMQRAGPWLTLADSLLDEHLLLVGSTGSGKTEALKRLAVETLAATERDLFFVDGKGDVALGREMVQLLYNRRRRPVPWVQLGTGTVGSPYHGLPGDALAVYNRLVTLAQVEQASGDAFIFAQYNRELLQLACFAPGQAPPRSLDEVRRRLDPGWLQAAYAQVAHELQAIAALPPKRFAETGVHIRTLARELAGLLDERGFTLEESGGAVFTLRTPTAGDTGRRFLNFLLEDFKDFVGKRQQRPALLVIDEFSAFRSETILELLALARSARLGVVLATQDLAALGDAAARRMILANTRTKLLLASDFPEDVAELAGTLSQLETSVQHEAGQPTGRGSAHLRPRYRIDLNEAARLQAGEAFVIRQRHAAKVRVRRVGPIPTTAQALMDPPATPNRPAPKQDPAAPRGPSPPALTLPPAAAPGRVKPRA